MEAREDSFTFCDAVYQLDTIETMISTFLDSFHLSNRTKEFAGIHEVKVRIHYYFNFLKKKKVVLTFTMKTAKKEEIYREKKRITSQN